MREVAAGLDELAHRRLVHFIRGVYDQPHLWWEHVEHYDVFPSTLPRLHDGPVFLAPGAVSEVL